MLKVKAFVSYAGLADNTPGTIAPVGELSSYSSTFARDTTLHSDPAVADMAVTVFTSASDVSGKMAVPSVLSAKLLAIGAWVRTRQTAVVGTDTKTAFLNDFASAWGSTATGVVVTQMVVGPNGKLWPSDISWSDSSYATEPNICRLWFSDSVFRMQYDDYEIIVIPPMSVDTLFGDYTAVAAALANIGFAQKVAAIQTARDVYPETVMAAQTYPLVNINNPIVSVNTDWSFLIYGPRGNDQDLIRQAVTDYITTHSTHTLQEWQAHFPDIFKSLEFLMIPDWATYAIAPLTNSLGIHSPVVKLGALLARLKTVLSAVSATHIQNTATAIVHPYTSLQMGVVGSENNRENKFSLLDVFPDLLMLSSTSTDFSRMSVNTQGFLNRLAEMLSIAETLTIEQDVPTTFRKVSRGGLLYISCNYNNATFMVSTKLSTPA